MRIRARLLSVIMLLLALGMLFAPVPALAQASLPQWYEQRTRRFAILYTDGNLGQAETYAAFVDGIYDEVASIFGQAPPIPVTLRLYPTRVAYDAANPLAVTVPGIVAHADFRRNEVVVILDQTTSQTAEEVQNNVRHELVHIVAAEISQNRLNVGFQEGLAQYVERPSPELDRKVEALRRAMQQDALLAWSALDDREQIYGSPQIGYPQTLSIVAFLVERYTFARFREFLTVSASSSGYRSALERVYGVPPAELERLWREWLPSYIDGGYRQNALSAYDLAPIEALVAAGRYADARRELELAIPWLRTTRQDEVLARARQLLERSEAGLYADDLARQTRAALERADYPAAADLALRASAAYVALGDSTRTEALAAYAAMAERGKRAMATLDRATALAADWRTYIEARAAADSAAVEFLSLGNQYGAARALALRAELDRVQSLAGAVLLLTGLAGIAVGFVRRLAVREAEAW